MKTKKPWRFLFLVLPLISLASAFAYVPYEFYRRDLDMYGYEALPVREPIYVGGFKLIVNRTQLGYTVYAKPVGNVLATLQGDDFTINILRLPSSKTPLEQVALQMNPGNYKIVTVTPMITRFGTKGIRATYGGKPSIFADHIQEIRYFFMNRSGEIICFSGKAKKSHSDWTYFRYLMAERLSPLGSKG